MASGPSSFLLRFIRKLAAPQTGSEAPDGVLLEQFLTLRDEAAFTRLVGRHGPMVLAVCRSILNDSNDAEDAFQATFLVLVRKGRSIGKPDSLGSWLHGVAYRLALKARGAAARRRVQESRAATMSSVEPEHETIWRDLQPVLHDEVNRLPERYRKPFVLCYLEGRTNEEAAQILGWPKGTVLSSLARARDRLRDRLTRRGVALSAAVLTTLLAQSNAPAAVPGALIDATVKSAAFYAMGHAAAGGIPATVLTYTNSMLQAMFVDRLKLIVVILLAGAVAAGSGLVAYHAWPGDKSAAVENNTLPLPHPTPTRAEELPEPLPMPAAEEPARPDQELLLGAWVVVGSQQAGKAIDVFVKGDRLVFNKDEFSMNAQRGEPIRLFRRGTTTGKFNLDTTSTPRRIDLVEKGRTLQGIYSLDGDMLKLCLKHPEEPAFPTEFAAQPDHRFMLLIFQRE